ncbi:MAG: SPOR domain-containing protein [Hyphomonadaceae bacterium]|nr:SPOR domain-containing protein [Hyphomonadaceae bacterium]
MENEPQDAYLPDSDLEKLQPFDVREQNSRKGMVMLVGGFLFLLLLAFIIMKLFSSGTRDRDQTPRILADAEPYKEVPLERGGEETPNQDKEIYDVLNGTTSEVEVSVLPPAETPMSVPKTAEVKQPAANVVIKEPGGSTTTPVTEPVEQPKVDKGPRVRVPVSTAKIPTSPPPSPATSGNYFVQVASLRSQDEANRLWGKLSSNMGDIITSSYYADVKRVDLNERGIYYRLRVGGLLDKDAAQNMCNQLKSRGQDCIISSK